MTGPEHYREAEQLLMDADEVMREGDDSGELIAAAQVHATLALAAANGVGTDTVSERPTWRITDDHLQEVANVYGAADRAGGAPTRAVANRFDVPHSTAAKWVGRARKQGLLPAVEGGAA